MYDPIWTVSQIITKYDDPQKFLALLVAFPAFELLAVL